MLALPAIRLATAADAREIAAMSREHIEQGLPWSWTGPRVLRAIRDPATNVIVAHGGCILGFGIMEYGEDKAHLVLLGVRSAQRRRGLARQLLQWLEDSARAAGIGRVQVEARIDNPAALAFYAALGYRRVRRLPKYYSGLLEAIRFEKELWVV